MKNIAMLQVVLQDPQVFANNGKVHVIAKNNKLVVLIY